MTKLHTRAAIEHSGGRRLLRVSTLADLEHRYTEPNRVALLVDELDEPRLACALASARWGACITVGNLGRPDGWAGTWISALADPRAVASGDVIAVDAGSTRLSVLYRRGSNGNVLFVTERCNSRCLMCSQPPREQDDSWRIRDILELIDLVDPDEPCLAITGGEPTLLGADLHRIVAACSAKLPATAVHVLSNGRALSNSQLTSDIVAADHPNLTWAIPLYGDTSTRHDFVVQASGAFDETLLGLCNLARFHQQIELRIVLQQQTVPRLDQLAYFIFRNLSFVSHVALMGLEPMGFARQNRGALWIDPIDYVDELESAVYHLHNRGLPVSIYNLPLCVLPASLWPFARQSISDWKRTYVEECIQCAVRSHCSGFFTSAGPAWRSRSIRAVSQREHLE